MTDSRMEIVGMQPEWYRLEVSGGGLNGGHIVRADRDTPNGFGVVVFNWKIIPPRVMSSRGRVAGAAVRRLTEAIESCQFWEMPTEGGPVGWDGMFYHFDAVVGDRAHRVVRWSQATRELAGFNALYELLEEFGRVATENNRF